MVKDEKGRFKRFHGAFTGGFSAGYFNTVGTKEGELLQCLGETCSVSAYPACFVFWGTAGRADASTR